MNAATALGALYRNDKVGLIIGKKGSTLTQIQEESGQHTALQPFYLANSRLVWSEHYLATFLSCKFRRGLVRTLPCNLSILQIQERSGPHTTLQPFLSCNLSTLQPFASIRIQNTSQITTFGVIFNKGGDRAIGAW